MQYEILETLKEEGYELLDSGDSEKLERYGDVITRRPDPQALWKKSLDASKWNAAQAFFSRSSTNAKWNIAPGTPKEWTIPFAHKKFIIRPTAFKHTGLFPEHRGNWEFIERSIKEANREVSVLNLFGYTGGATLAAAAAGASACHVDGSKVAVSWARKNAVESGLESAPIRWIVDDARMFLKREVKRGKKYDGIILDPPAFGHGPEGELWKIEEDLIPLLDLCKSVLTQKPLFLLLNGYASGYSALAYKNVLEPLIKDFGGSVQAGELTIKESSPLGRNLSCGIFARWTHQ